MVKLTMIGLMLLIGCECDTSKPTPRGTVNTHKVEIEVITSNNNSNNNDNQIEDRLNNLENRVLTLEQSYTDINNRLTSLYNTVDEYHVVTQEYINTLQVDVQTLVSNYTTSSQTITNLNLAIEQLNNTSIEHNSLIQSILVSIEGIRTQILNEVDINILINRTVQGYSYFLNPCEYTDEHTELVFVLNKIPYAWFVDCNHKGGLVKLEFNKVYSSTVGKQCRFKINNNLQVIKL